MKSFLRAICGRLVSFEDPLKDLFSFEVPFRDYLSLKKLSLHSPNHWSPFWKSLRWQTFRSFVRKLPFEDFIFIFSIHRRPFDGLLYTEGLLCNLNLQTSLYGSFIHRRTVVVLLDMESRLRVFYLKKNLPICSNSLEEVPPIEDSGGLLILKNLFKELEDLSRFLCTPKEDWVFYSHLWASSLHRSPFEWSSLFRSPI